MLGMGHTIPLNILSKDVNKRLSYIGICVIHRYIDDLTRRVKDLGFDVHCTSIFTTYKLPFEVKHKSNWYEMCMLT